MGEEVVEEEDMLGGIGTMAEGATVMGKAGTASGRNASPLAGKIGKSKVSKSRNLRD